MLVQTVGGKWHLMVFTKKGLKLRQGACFGMRSNIYPTLW